MRALLLYLARQEGFKNFALSFKFFRDTASRFIAGESIDDAIRAVQAVNQNRICATLDLLGENTLLREDAHKACQGEIAALDRIQSEKVDCNISIKLTQLGLNLDLDFCEQNLLEIVEHARRLDDFVRVDMEDSSCADRTLDLVDRVHAQFDNVGTVIQAYLFRSERDLNRMLKSRIRIRLVKGAYLEPESVAFRKKKDTDANFVRLMQMLLKSHLYHAIATHDEAIIAATQKFALAQSIPRDHFEFQMLYGVRRDLQQRLAQEGYNVRVYIPYGRSWYPYFMRRLAERPANVAFIIRSLFKERSQASLWL